MPELTNLEAAEQPQETPAPPNPAELPADDNDLEQHAVDVPATTLRPQNEKVVPIGAVKSERQARRELAKQLQETSAKLEQALQFQQQATPILQALQGRQDIIDMLQGKQPVQQTKPEDDPEAREYAESLGLYTATGELDLTRGAKVRDLAAKRAAKEAQAVVQPFQQSTVQAQAQANYEWALNLKDPQGRPWAKAETVKNVLGAMPANMLADRTIVQQALIYARGLDPVPAAAQPHEVLFTESPGRMPTAPQQIGAIDRAAMQAIGTNEKTWSQLTAKYGERGSINLEGE